MFVSTRIEAEERFLKVAATTVVVASGSIIGTGGSIWGCRKVRRIRGRRSKSGTGVRFSCMLWMGWRAACSILRTLGGRRRLPRLLVRGVYLFLVDPWGISVVSCGLVHAGGLL